MRRDDLIAKLKANADVIRSYGVGSLYLFGSHARDEATATSDVDLFIDRDPGNRLRHAYDRLHADIIWDIATRHVPDLKSVVEAMKRELKEDNA